jgi:hypothetical protein
VNFFGHAALACRESSAPAFVLGSMLPDFWAMIRARSPVISHAELASGIAFHHTSDAAFHDAPTFRLLTRWAFEALIARGLERGRARAVAHVGIEILLDGELARDERARVAYRQGLAMAAPDALGGCIAWRNTGESQRFENLRIGLAARGIAADDVSPALVAFRLERALTGRKRLALEPSHTALVEHWSREAAPRVSQHAAPLFEEVARAVLEVRHRPTR